MNSTLRAVLKRGAWQFFLAIRFFCLMSGVHGADLGNSEFNAWLNDRHTRRPPGAFSCQPSPSDLDPIPPNCRWDCYCVYDPGTGKAPYVCNFFCEAEKPAAVRSDGGAPPSKRFKRQDCAAVRGFEALASDKSDIGTVEYSFFVVMERDGIGGVYYRYTDAVAGTSGGTSAQVGRGVIVRGYSHNHPRSYAVQGFSPGDRMSFVNATADFGKEITFYLRTPLGQIIKAETLADFPNGKDVSSRSCL